MEAQTTVRMMIDNCIVDMFKKNIAKYRNDPPFTLTSGKISPWYFDIKTALMDVEVCRNIKYFINYCYHQGGIGNFDIVGGMANGGYSMVSMSFGTDLFFEKINGKGFVYRKKAKEHGLQNRIDGYHVSKGDKVLLLEDVITTGGSLVPVIEYVEECGGVVSQIFCVVDRIEGNPNPKFEKYKSGIISMINLDQAKKAFDQMENKK